jgi:quinolinate synthase
MGSRLTVVGHHYQEETVIRHTDLRGDSLELARKVAAVNSEHIMFCGVYFMAESAALLARPGQKVYLPDLSAECSMALMSPASLVDDVLGGLCREGRKVTPLAYVNSTLGVKAVVGKYGGSVCTSANARIMMEWAFAQGDAVLFLPDRNLGANTADILGIPESDRHLLDIRGKGTRIDHSRADKARLLLWPGHCSIHTRFSTRQIERMRSDYPDARIVAHPECAPAVVEASDAAGSTSFIIRYVAELPAGSTVIIATELNLVKRLAAEHAGRVTVLPLVESACPHMAQITEEKLEKALLSALDEKNDYRVVAPVEYREHARKALETMLRVCA